MSELIDNRAQRVRNLKGIIKRLHAGEAPDEVRASLKELVCRTDYSEVMTMEQELIADGMPVEEIQDMCDLHSQVTREVLVQLAPPPVPPGHPVDTFRRENETLYLVRTVDEVGAAKMANAAPVRWSCTGRKADRKFPRPTIQPRRISESIRSTKRYKPRQAANRIPEIMAPGTAASRWPAR